MRHLYGATVFLWALCLLLLASFCVSGEIIVRPIGKRSTEPSLWQLLKAEKSARWFYRIAKKTYMKGILETRGMTIFVPTDAAYSKLSSKTKRLLNYDLNKLYYVILYHFAIDAIYSQDSFVDGMMIPLGLDKKAFFNVRRHGKSKEANVWVQGKKLIKQDMIGRNGVMHLIDGVMMPPEQTLIDLLDADPNSDIMKNMLRRANMILPSGYTLFVPHNNAFKELSKAGRRRINRGRKAIRRFVSQHILPRPVFMSAILGNGRFNATTLARTTLMFEPTKDGVKIMIPGSKKLRVVRVHKSDLFVTNGVIHSVLHVLSSDDTLFKKPIKPIKPSVTKKEESVLAKANQVKEETIIAPTQEATAVPPTTQEPTTMAPTTQEPTTVAPTTQEPTTVAPTTQEPTTVAPTTQEPTTMAPTTQEPTTVVPTTQEPTTMAPTTQEPTTVAPTTQEPTTMAPTTQEPTTMAPTTQEPTTVVPTTQEPTTVAPTTQEPTTVAPTTQEPTTVAPTTQEPTTMAPTTEEPTTVAPTTQEPTTMAPTTQEPTTMAPTTQEPTTIAPTTQEPTTMPLTTQEPTTVAPTTEEPTTVAPTTQEPTTVASATQEPTTMAPTTQEPTTVAPTTQEPTTVAPTTQEPTTVAPTTQEPTTVAPTTQEPTTIAPTTQEPTTVALTTQEQTTMASTTQEPTTMAPTTQEPTTIAPTTQEPTTIAPTTQEPTTLAQTTLELTTKTATTLQQTTMTSTTQNPTTKPPKEKPTEVTKNEIAKQGKEDSKGLPERNTVRQLDVKPKLLNLRDLLRKNDLTEFLSYIMQFDDLKPILTATEQKYTLFAPTNEAFANLNGVNERSLNEDLTYRKHIIKHHIVPGAMQTKNLRFKELNSMSGDNIIVRSYEKRRMANDAFVLSHDEMASNGRINIIDRLMIPRENNLVSVLTNREEPPVALFRRAVELTGMLPILEKATPHRFIVWVPTDAAFLKLPLEVRQYIFTNRTVLKSIVDFHLTPGYFHTNLMTTRWVYVFRTRFRNGKLKVRKLSEGQKGLLVFTTDGQRARSVLLNLGATNGIVNLIDTILFPPNFKISSLVRK